MTFEFYRYRFDFRALETLYFPPGKSGNTVRGAFGMALYHSAGVTGYRALFEPRGNPGTVPSGLADLPRPFVFRAAHLDSRTVSEGGQFSFDAHIFDLRRPLLDAFCDAFAAWRTIGLGPRRSLVELERVCRLGLDDRELEDCNASPAPLMISLDPAREASGQIRLHFLTPTELKSEGVVVPRPEFPILFARLRDRISTLRAIYGGGEIGIDFASLGERAESVRLRNTHLTWERAERKSGRTGQVHPIGGFTGSAEYEGDLREFLPWLRAARWTGVGRQTVWGKGDVRVEEPSNRQQVNGADPQDLHQSATHGRNETL